MAVKDYSKCGFGQEYGNDETETCRRVTVEDEMIQLLEANETMLSTKRDTYHRKDTRRQIRIWVAHLGRRVGVRLGRALDVDALERTRSVRGSPRPHQSPHKQVT